MSGACSHSRTCRNAIWSFCENGSSGLESENDIVRETLTCCVVEYDCLAAMRRNRRVLLVFALTWAFFVGYYLYKTGDSDVSSL